MKQHTYLKTLLFAVLFFTAGMVRAQVIVVATAATPGPTVYPDLTAAFAAINAGTHQGAIGVAIMANSTEAGPCVLNSSGAGPAIYTSVIIGPGADGVTLSAPTVAGRGVIELKGADNVTIDGDNPNTAGINRNLTIVNTAANTIAYTSCIRIATAATVVATADNNIIRNCNLTGSASGRNLTGVTSTTGSENTTFGIYAGGNGGATDSDAPTAITSVTTNTAVAATTINALLVTNNVIISCARGVVFNGATAAVSNGVTISNNTIGGAGVLSTYPFTAPSNTVYTKGVWVNGTNAITVTGNTIQNILSYVGTAMSGIELAGGIGSGTINISNNTIAGVALNSTSASAARGIWVNNAGGPYTISGNTISTIQNNGSTSNMGIEVITTAASGLIEKNIISGVYARSTGGYGAFGIQLNGGNAVTVQNNFISDLNAVDNNSATSTLGPMGIRITAGSSHKIYYNSINLYGPVLAGGSFAEPSACVMITSSGLTGLDIRNNVFQNTRTGSFTGSANMCIGMPSGLTSTANHTINNNAYYLGTGATYYISMLSSGTGYTVANFNPAVITPATNFRSYTSTLNAAGTNDNASFASNAAAPFISNSNLHVNVGAANAADLDAKAVVIATIATDIDVDARNATTPDIGGDEFVIPGCIGANGGTISPSTQTTCANSTVVMTSTGASTGTGISYQWKFATVSGGPYSNVVGGSGATTLTYTTGALTVGTYYYVLQATCTTGPTTGLSNELTVTVNPSPTVGVSPTTSTLCLPGGSPITLTANGATTYTWGPAAGLSATTGTSVTASPTVTTTYTVTGTTAGCTGTATTTITVAVTPTITVTATPSSVCSGGSSQLLASAAIPVTSYNVTSIPYAATTGTGTSIVTGDDVVSAAVTIPFPFSFYGTSYTSLFAYSNGFIQLGTSSSSTTAYAGAIPAAAAPNNIIAGVWSDLNVVSPAMVYSYVSGSAPNRVFTVAYDSVKFYSNVITPFTTGSISFQIKLFETSNVVEVHVGRSTGASTTTLNKTLGVENSTGTAGTTPAGHNAANWSAATPEAWRFVPDLGTYNYVWTPSTFLTATNIPNPMATNVTATTTYSVTATATTGCTATGSVTLTAGSALTSTSSAAPSNTVCAGTNVTLSSSPVGGGLPYTYAWSGPNSFSSTLQNPVITAATPAASGIYTVIVTDACGATSTTSVTLTVNPLPVVAATPTTATYCNPGTPVALSATGAPAFTWGPAAGLSATTGANVNATPTITTTYTVTGTNANGCVSTATTTITSAPAVTGATASATLAAICTGSSTTLNSSASPYSNTLLTEGFNAPTNTWTTVNLSTGGTPANAAWTLRPNGYSPGGFWTPALNSNDNSQFYLTNADAQGSGSTANTILQSPAFSTVGYSSVTLNFFHYYRFNAAPDSAIVEASTDGNNWTRVQFYTSPTVGAPTAFASASVNLNAFAGNPTVYVRFHYRAPWGYGWAVDNVSIVGNSNAFTYSWSSTPIGFSSTAQNPTNVGPTATSTYTVQITNVFGCSATANTSITVNPLPTVTANTTASVVCAGDAVTLTGGGATSYTWTNSVTNNVAFTPAATDSYTVTGTDANGCTNTASLTVTVNPLPSVALSGTNSFCAGGNTVLTGTSGGTSQWYLNGNLIIGATSNTYTATAAGVYNMTKTNSNGCSDSAATGITVTVNALPTVVANATATAVCAGSPVTLTGSGATSYTWDNSVTDNVAFVPSATTTYMVTGTDGNGCQNTDMITVNVNALPTVVANSTASAVCTGGAVTLTGSGASTYTWDNSVTDNVSFVPSTTTTYMVTGTDVNGCQNTDNITVIVNTLPTVTANATATTVCENDAVTLSGSGASTYTWDNSVTDNVPFAATTTTTYMVTGTDVNGCTDTDMITVNVNALPVITVSFFMDTVCFNGGLVTLSGESPAGGTWSGTGVVGNTFDPQVAGLGWEMITYSYTDGNSCTNSLTDSLNVDVCNGVIPVASVGNVTIYPNPNEGQFTIQLPAVPTGSVQVEVMNELGQVVDAFTMTSTTKEVNISAYKGGVYFVRVINAGNVSVHRIVKQ